MNGWFDNPILAAAVECLAAGAVLAGLARLVRGRTLPGLVAPTVFIASYVLAYQRVPAAGGPVDSVAKIFYVAVAGALLGAILDLTGARFARRLAATVLPLVILAWIGQRRFAQPDPSLLLTCLGLWLGGMAVLWRLDGVAAAEEGQDGGSLAAISILMLLAVAFAPIALASGSSTSLLLSLAFGAGLASAALWELGLPRGSFTAATLFGAGGGLLAVIDTVTLITRQMDFLALLLLLPILVAGQFGARLLPRRRFTGRTRQILVGLLAALPLPLVVAIVLLRHPDAFSS